MRNLDAIINQLSAEQMRCEHLLLEDMEGVKKACTLFFDKQAREADAFMALLHQTLDDIANRVKNGYERKREPDDDKPFPAIVTGRKLTDDERAALMGVLDDATQDTA